MPNNKARGPDGLSAELKKTVLLQLASLFMPTVKDFNEEGKVLEFMSSAHI